MKLKKNLKNFVSDGFAKFEELLDKESCNKLFANIVKDRNWGKELFQSENDFKNEFKHGTIRKVNPGKGIQNLVDKHNLTFIEKNSYIIELLNIVLGQDYEVILPKFIIAASKNWLPEYVKTEVEKNSNLNPYLKKEYRDVTYFQGIDFHMDSIDWENKDNQFVTLYIYLNDVDVSMSPLNVVKGSHKFGHTSYPHFIKSSKDNKTIEYSPDNNHFERFSCEQLTGKSGTVFLWTSNTLHGTPPSKNNNDQFRISLRYLIKKNIKSKGLIDECVKQKTVGKARLARENYKKFLK